MCVCVCVCMCVCVCVCSVQTLCELFVKPPDPKDKRRCLSGGGHDVCLVLITEQCFLFFQFLWERTLEVAIFFFSSLLTLVLHTVAQVSSLLEMYAGRLFEKFSGVICSYSYSLLFNLSLIPIVFYAVMYIITMCFHCYDHIVFKNVICRPPLVFLSVLCVCASSRLQPPPSRNLMDSRHQQAEKRVTDMQLKNIH